MYRIKIDDVVKGCARTYAKNFESGHRDNYETSDQRLDDLMNNLSCSKAGFKPKAINYIKELKRYRRALLNILPSKFDYWQKHFENIIPQTELDTIVKFRNHEKEFYKHITFCLRYDQAKKRMPQYIEEIGIEACIYCNLIPAGINDNQEPDYTFDHLRCQSRYPYFCASFYNLYPCCGHCNSVKNDEDYPGFFELYVEDNSNQNPYKVLMNGALKIYLDEKNCKKIHPKLTSPSGYGQKVIDKLNLKSWYNGSSVHKQMEKIFRIIKGYPKINLDTTKATLKKLGNFNDEDLFTIFHVELKEENIHKEILTKFNIDFCKELGLL